MKLPTKKQIDKIIKNNFKDREMLTQSPKIALQNLKARMLSRMEMYSRERSMNTKSGISKKELAVWDTALEVVTIDILRLENIEMESNIVDTLIRIEDPEHPKNRKEQCEG